MTGNDAGPEPLKTLLERGYERRKCASCGGVFYTADPDRDLCGDTPCVEYTFIGNPCIPGDFDIDSMRERYLSFFDKDHTRVDRAAVIPRWRKDVLLVNASIYVFQPHVTSGEVPPPANPLTISQPCIRMVDIDAVGRSGRHLSNFEMMAHHAFNTPEKEIYWKEVCVGYNADLLRGLGVKDEDVTYKENPWVGGGNGGNALEVMVGGLELSTLVFMDHRLDPEGKVTIKGQRFSPMDLKVVDTGYGLERFVWCSGGQPTIYDCLFPKEIAGVKDLVKADVRLDADKELWTEMVRLSGVMNIDTTSQVMELRRELVKRLEAKGFKLSIEELADLMAPFEALYGIVDHSRCIGLMLHDDLIPSDSKAGYLARLVIRKALRLMERLGIEEDIADIVMMHRDDMKGFADLGAKEEHIRRILELETERYHETASRAGKLVERYRDDLERGPVDSLLMLYSSHGLHPDIVKREAGRMGLDIEVPDAFNALVSERAEKGEDGSGEQDAVVEPWMARAANDIEKLEVPATRKLYYESPMMREFEATVLYSCGDVVVLDSTAMYPEGGGQPCDLGTLKGEGGVAEVSTVQKIGNVIVHKVKGNPPKVGDVVEGRVDWKRRLAHMRHHTATHIVLGAARRVLGPHVWQAGAAKRENMARLDVTHFARVSDEERWDIEGIANEIVLEGIDMECVNMPREQAERKYGMRLYQGGPPASKTIRVLRIGDFDVQGCGGTHCSNTSEVGPIKITRVKRIQDGVVRLEYSAGMAAVSTVQEMERLLIEASAHLSVPVDHLPKSVKRFFEEWKAQKKEIEKLKVSGQTGEAGDRSETVGDHTVTARLMETGRKQLPKISRKLTNRKGSVAVLVAVSGDDVAFSVGHSGAVGVDANEVVKATAEAFGGSGGGKRDFAQGAVKGASKAGDVLESLKVTVMKMLSG